jgi:hypothetical protein
MVREAPFPRLWARPPAPHLPRPDQESTCEHLPVSPFERRALGGDAHALVSVHAMNPTAVKRVNDLQLLSTSVHSWC